MPSKSLHKVHKQISKKRGGRLTALHQNSRDAQRLQRASARDAKIVRVKAEKEKGFQSHLQRTAYIQKCLGQLPSAPSLEPTHILDVVRAYLSRNDAELEELAASRRQGRPPSNRETQLRHQKVLEEKELTSGFWAPDLQDAETVEKLRGWNGEWVPLGQMKFLRIDGDGKVKEAAWPPGKG
ncbi:hypothetical protein NA57DRAFT_75480 [Rhizodiscina lignyota]|uniref:Translation machinery-associated protein 16 n=1 Tax=Rhizodiscina lignyota TaxID=1504668 RepID=A0A9P4IH95_9PEZI|nr:hypothetical protein NA57DRAFT_75480 [Rhizodiscina lignyota]